MTIISLTLTFVEIKILFLLAEREKILKDGFAALRTNYEYLIIFRKNEKSE